MADSADRQEKPPRTDVGTLVLHWATAVAFFISLFTGIRIAADALNAPVSHWLNPILPQGEIWTWHFLSGLALFFCAAAYLVYLRRAGLSNRNALKKTRVMALPVAKKMRFGGLNVALHWAAYAIIVIMTATGIFLYLGWGGWLISVHSYVAFIGLGYIFVHILAHYLFGGWWQIFRVFRPARLGGHRSREAEAAADRRCGRRSDRGRYCRHRLGDARHARHHQSRRRAEARRHSRRSDVEQGAAGSHPYAARREFRRTGRVNG